MMRIDQAVHFLRNNRQYADLVRDAYLGADVHEAAQRFLASAEFAEQRTLLAHYLDGGQILDLGAGNGIAAFAFAQNGARQVYAVEPDPSDEVGRGAIHRLTAGLPVTVIDAKAEQIPLPAQEVDIVYGRQVLHHIGDLSAAMRECARVLKSGGLFMACREHVVKSAADRRRFLDNHPMHQLTGGENAYTLSEYQDAIQGAGLTLKAVLQPWDSVINAFPATRTAYGLKCFPRCMLASTVGKLAFLVSFVPGVNRYCWRRLFDRLPGRMYSFLAQKL